MLCLHRHHVRSKFTLPQGEGKHTAPQKGIQPKPIHSTMNSDSGSYLFTSVSQDVGYLGHSWTLFFEILQVGQALSHAWIWVKMIKFDLSTICTNKPFFCGQGFHWFLFEMTMVCLAGLWLPGCCTMFCVQTIELILSSCKEYWQIKDLGKLLQRIERVILKEHGHEMLYNENGQTKISIAPISRAQSRFRGMGGVSKAKLPTIVDSCTEDKVQWLAGISPRWVA